MQKITPFLWFNGNAEEAINFYTSVFKNAKKGNIVRYGKEGAVMTGTFQLEGQDFMALNGGPEFTFSPAISFFVNCYTQPEIDELWEKLSEGGEKQRCGWLKDKFGVSWQIVPDQLGKLLHGTDVERSGRVMKAMLQMNKLDIETLQQAYEGKEVATQQLATS